jgi:hypothetical protein
MDKRSANATIPLTKITRNSGDGGGDALAGGLARLYTFFMRVAGLRHNSKQGLIVYTISC